MGYKSRDVEVVSIDEHNCIVLACDSCGAVGSKEFDAVKVPSYIVGRFTARLTLLEILAVEAVPLAMTVASSNEPEPTTADILKGIKDELKALSLDELPLIISTEKNMKTSQTGLGISVTGLCQKTALRIAVSQPGDHLYCLGLPKVGSEVSTPDDPEIIQGKHIETLIKQTQIHDIIPVGSGGIRGEAESLAAQLGCRLELSTGAEVDVDKSAGPSTCLIFSSSPEYVPQGLLSIPLFHIGKLASY